MWILALVVNGKAFFQLHEQPAAKVADLIMQANQRLMVEEVKPLNQK